MHLFYMHSKYTYSLQNMCRIDHAQTQTKNTQRFICSACIQKHRQFTKHVQNNPNTSKTTKMQSINRSQKAKNASALHPSKNYIKFAKHALNNAHTSKKKV